MPARTSHQLYGGAKDRLASHHAQASRTATSHSTPYHPSVAHRSTMQTKGGAITSPIARGDTSSQSSRRTCVSAISVGRMRWNIDSCSGGYTPDCEVKLAGLIVRLCDAVCNPECQPTVAMGLFRRIRLEKVIRSGIELIRASWVSLHEYIRAATDLEYQRKVVDLLLVVEPRRRRNSRRSFRLIRHTILQPPFETYGDDSISPRLSPRSRIALSASPCNAPTCNSRSRDAAALGSGSTPVRA